MGSLIPDDARALLALHGRLSDEAVRNGGGRVDRFPVVRLVPATGDNSC